MLRTVSAYRHYWEAKRRWKKSGGPEELLVGTDHLPATFGAMSGLLSLLKQEGHQRAGIELPSNSSLRDWVLGETFFGSLASEAVKRGICVVPIDVASIPIETELKFDVWYHALAILDQNKGNLDCARKAINFEVRKLKFLLEKMGGIEGTDQLRVKMSRAIIVARILEEGTVESIEQRIRELNTVREARMETVIKEEGLNVVISGELHALELRKRLPEYEYLFI